MEGGEGRQQAVVRSRHTGRRGLKDTGTQGDARMHSAYTFLRVCEKTRRVAPVVANVLETKQALMLDHGNMGFLFKIFS